MELQGTIEQGSMARLRKEANAAQNQFLKSVQMLSNALLPVVGIDSFLPRSANPSGGSDRDALTKNPVLIACADEERKQFLIPHIHFIPKCSPCDIYIYIGFGSLFLQQCRKLSFLEYGAA